MWVGDTFALQGVEAGGQGVLAPSVITMQQNTRLVVLTLEVSSTLSKLSSLLPCPLPPSLIIPQIFFSPPLPPLPPSLIIQQIPFSPPLPPPPLMAAFPPGVVVYRTSSAPAQST